MITLASTLEFLCNILQVLDLVIRMIHGRFQYASTVEGFIPRDEELLQDERVDTVCESLVGCDDHRSWRPSLFDATASDGFFFCFFHACRCGCPAAPTVGVGDGTGLVGATATQCLRAGNGTFGIEIGHGGQVVGRNGPTRRGGA